MNKSSCLILIVLLFAAVSASAQRGGKAEKEGIHGKVDHYVSEIDGETRPYAVCATDDSPTPKPLILEVSPGASNVKGGVKSCENIARMAAQNGRSCVALRPTSRGPGTVNQNYGEVDTLEAIRDVMSKHSIDPQRIVITGSSMGGASTWYLTSHNPDLFAAAAPFCGYCDYLGWEKPGGLTFYMRDWEEPSWQARSAVMLIENFIHTPMRITHGEWDRAVGGGVPVEQSQKMQRLLEEQGFEHTYIEVPKTGHGCRGADTWEATILWLLDQRKIENPAHVKLATYELRHNKSYWVTIEQLKKYGGIKATVDAKIEDGLLKVDTKNVRTLSLGPIGGVGVITLRIDGWKLGWLDMSKKHTFRKKGWRWKAGEFDLSAQKRHGCSGPVSDIFCENTIVVPGAAGDDAEDHYLATVAANFRQYFQSRNGGVHRGGIMGQNQVVLPLHFDEELPEGMKDKYNLLLYGNYNTNSILKSFEGQLPLKFNEDSIEVCGRKFKGDKVAVFAVFPHPNNPERYVAVHGGVEPDAVTWGSHLDTMLLPDYIVYNRGKTVDWGFWGNDWEKP